MWKTRFFSLVFMIVIAAVVAPVGVSAQELLPTDDPMLMEPEIVETIRLERVETADGQTLLIPTFTMEMTQKIHSSGRNSPKSSITHPSGWTMTMWRALWWQPSFWGNYEVKTGGRTSTDVTADILYVWIDHKSRPSGGGTWTGIRSNYKNVNYATTTGDVWTGTTTMAARLEHAAEGDHQARVGPDQWLIRNNEWGPQRVIP